MTTAFPLPATAAVTTLPAGGPMAGGRAWNSADEAAYAAFYTASFPAVLRTVTLMLRDRAAAEDITQEAFIQLYVHWRKVSSYDAPQAWVRRIAIRMAQRYARREWMRELLSRRAQQDEAMSDAPGDVDLERAIHALVPQHRAVVALYYFDDLPVAEIARALDRSPSWVKVTLHRARQTLADRLALREGEPT